MQWNIYHAAFLIQINYVTVPLLLFFFFFVVAKMSVYILLFLCSVYLQVV